MIHLHGKTTFYKKLFSLVLPLALQNLMSAIVSASDAIMLGFLNQDSLSAVSLATQVQFVLNLFFSGLRETLQPWKRHWASPPGFPC